MRARVLFELLRGLAPYGGVPDDALLALCHVVQEVVLEDGDTLFQEGDAGRAAYIVISGQVALVERGVEGGAVTRQVVGPGDLFGELALFSAGRRALGAVVSGRTCLACIEYDAFLDLVRAHPSIAIALLRLQTERFLCLEAEYRALRERS